MISVSARSSVASVRGLSMQLLSALALELSYIDGGIFYATKNRNVARRYLIDQEGNFPAGLVSRVSAWLRQREMPFDYVDERTRPAAGTLGLTQRCLEPEAYMEQCQAVDVCAADLEGKGVVVMPTGVGKTRAIKDLILRLQVPTLVVPPSANLKWQLLTYLTECFGEENVGLLEKYKRPKPILICNIDSLENKRKEHLSHIQCVVIDEFHHSAAATYRTVDRELWDHIYWKFGFTATNYRNNAEEAILLESVLSKELFSMTPVEGMNRGLIVPIKAIAFRMRNERIQPSTNYATVYRRFIVENTERNLKIAQVANNMVAKGVPTLVLVKQVEHGRVLSEMIRGAKFVNGQSEGSEWNMEMVRQFNALQVPCLVGTSVIGEGVDTKAAGCVVIAASEKAESRICQNVGRVVRKFPGKQMGFVVDFQDMGSKYVERHSKERLKIYSKHFGSEASLFD